jgi:hypothetical protein
MGLIIVAAATRRRKVEVCVMVDGCWCVVRRVSFVLCELCGGSRDDTRGTQWKKRLNLSRTQEIFTSRKSVGPSDVVMVVQI